MADVNGQSVDGSSLESELLKAELASARARLAEAHEALLAIQSGEVDAVVVSGPDGDRIVTLHDAEYAYRALVEAMNEGAAILAKDDTVLYCNQRLADLSGIRLERIIGSPVASLVTKDATAILEELLTSARAGFPGSADFDFSDAPGHCTAVLSLREMNGLGEGVLCMVVTNITGIKENEQKLRSLTAFMQSILASSPFATIVTDLTGTMTSVNPAAQRMLGYQEEELTHRETPLLLLDPDELCQRAVVLSAELGQAIEPGMDVLTAKPRRGLVEEAEWKLLRKDGSDFDAQLTFCGLTDAGGKLVGLILIAYDITERKKAQEHISHLAHHDALTGLPTRTLLRDRLGLALNRARRYGRKVGLLMVDIDNFKRINDLFGHQAGDSLLMAVAQRLQNCVRTSDTVARMGGDEFIILLDELRSVEDGEFVAEKLAEQLALPVEIGSRSITTTASIGICVYPDNGDTAEFLLKNADAAMYRAKAEGRNRYQSFTQELASSASRKRQLENALSHALVEKEFELVYQPQISMRTGEVTGVEALLRWRSGKLGLVMPNDFIPLAEESGLIVPIGEWVIRTACRQGRELQLQIGRPLTIAVNVSPRQFQQNSLPQVIAEALREANLGSDCLELEITENILVGDLPRPMAVLERVRSLGVRIALDDFGTGFSSMSYILRFRVDRLKIDQSFIRKMTTDSPSLAITSAVIALSRGLNIPVIAEGVETDVHRDLLLAERCWEGQGYFYSRPVSMDNLPAVISAIEQSDAPEDKIRRGQPHANSAGVN